MGVHLITGGAGFIGVNLGRRLLERKQTVVALDDLSLGQLDFLTPLTRYTDFSFVKVDCSSFRDLSAVFAEIHARTPVSDVWHLAANSDIPSGVANPRIDLARTFLTTFEILTSMRETGIGVLHFASSSAVYGDAGGAAVGENWGALEPISNYGAMKLASEAQIRAACEAFLTRADIFRFPNVVGTPATHGVIVDLIAKGRANPREIEVLGDGTQRKIYLHVEDLIDAMLFIAGHANARYNVYNIGPADDGVTVREIAEMVRDRVAQGGSIRYGSGNKGWIGDVPRFRYATDKLSTLGWKSPRDSAAAIRAAVNEIADQLGRK
jgi:UDP-glucose 4-epimerase